MSRKTIKLTIDGERFVAMRAIPYSGEENDPDKATCPICRVYGAKRKPLADCTQFGFTWDSHLTIFKCKCGVQFFHEYRVWHDDEREK